MFYFKKKLKIDFQAQKAKKRLTIKEKKAIETENQKLNKTNKAQIGNLLKTIECK